MHTSHELRETLLQTDEEFRALSAKHHELDERLHELAVKAYLPESEQVEEITLKKRKLQLKDRMEDILRRHQQAATVASASV
jgi:uncharacterized protein YdcH (DUF465 family)